MCYPYILYAFRDKLDCIICKSVIAEAIVVAHHPVRARIAVYCIISQSDHTHDNEGMMEFLCLIVVILPRKEAKIRGVGRPVFQVTLDLGMCKRESSGEQMCLR